MSPIVLMTYLVALAVSLSLAILTGPVGIALFLILCCLGVYVAFGVDDPSNEK